MVKQPQQTSDRNLYLQEVLETQFAKNKEFQNIFFVLYTSLRLETLSIVLQVIKGCDQSTLYLNQGI